MNLHQQFLLLARDKNKITNKLLQLLPDIYASGIYKKYANTIEGYAWRFAQLPKSTVKKRLNLEKHLIDKPVLREAIAKVGVHKVALVASIVTPENEEIFVEKLQTMSKPAVQQLSKELRNKDVSREMHLKLDTNLQKLWDETKKKIGADLSDEEILFQLLTQNSKKSPGIFTKTLSQKQKHAVKAHYSNKCSYPNCQKQAEDVHHTDRYSKTKNHKNLTPLCKIHHQFMHHNLIKNETASPHKWQLQIMSVNDPVDRLYAKFRL